MSLAREVPFRSWQRPGRLLSVPLNGIEILVIAVIIILLFGAKKLPEFGRSLGTGMREFKESLTNGDEQEEAPERIDLRVGATTDSPEVDPSPRRGVNRVSQ